MVIGFENFLFLVNEIEMKFFVLLGSEIIGEIFFDFLCVNGLEWNCFVMLEMKYGWIMLDMVKIIDEQDVLIYILSKLIFILCNYFEYLEVFVLFFDDVC